MFFKLPIDIQVKILRDYIPTEDKYSLTQIESFSNLLKQKCCWRQPLKISFKKFHVHSLHLLSKIKPGSFVGRHRNAIFRVSINHFTGNVKIVELRSKNLIYRDYFKKTIKYSAEKFYSCIKRFYKFVQKVELNNIYETWNRDIITFDPDTLVLQCNPFKIYEMFPCHYNTFCTDDHKVFLHKYRNILIIFFSMRPCTYRDICAYLYAAPYMGNEEFNFKFPYIGSNVKILKAYYYKNNFRQVSSLRMAYKPNLHKIELKFVQRYESLNISSTETTDRFYLANIMNIDR